MKFFLILFLTSFPAFAKEENINVKGAENFTQLHLAVKNDDPIAVSNLLSRGADVFSLDIYDRAPIFYVKNAEIAKMLLEKNSNPNIADKWQTTVLHRASRYGYIEVVKLLIDHKANVNAIDSWGCQPIHKAAVQGNVEIVEKILQSGANINAKCNDGETPLFYAAAYVNLDAAKFLIENGADIFAKTNQGISILDIAKNDGGRIRPITLNSDPKIIKLRSSIVALLENKK